MLAALAALALGTTGCRPSAPDGAMADVNGTVITSSRVDEYDRLHPQAFGSESGDQRRMDVLNEVVMEEILEQRARKSHLEATDEDADEKLTDMKSGYTQEEFEQQLTSAHLTMQDMRTQVRRELTIDRLLNKDVFSRVSITDADLSTYYTTHQEEFHFAEAQYHLSRIVVRALPVASSTQPQAATVSREEALQTIQMVHLRLQEGEDFASLANSLARVKTAAIDADANMALSASQLHADLPLEDSVSKLLPGQTTDILASPDGETFAIYKLLSRMPAGDYSFQDPRVQQYIRETLRTQRGDLLKAAYYDMLRSQAHVRNYFAERLLQ
ncbi:SurA N-terminal domain-containing protein [Silvibacterium sp.]|uniref:peptidylprolyl isomerase n=1 Tax=Silvibacterium sp. TaxID=1964179 RepID=UPI0039E36A39